MKILKKSHNILDSIEYVILTDEADTFPFTQIYEADGESCDYIECSESEDKLRIVQTKSDVESILKCIRDAKYINILPRRNYRQTLKKYSMTTDDAINIVRNLSASDYCYSLKSTNDEHLGNNLIVLTSKGPFKLANESVLTDVEIYIKIDSDESCDELAIIVSLHEAKHSEAKAFN